jgi:pimeloyl-ACP methyl ester carboxylesterase
MGTAVLQRQPVQAGGHTVEAVVLGQGPVTVVFVNGLGSPLEEWTFVAPTIAERSKVVCYDRRPVPATGPLPTHDATQLAAELHELLDALGVTGPLVLVGHSWGGAIIRRYAADHPEAVAGMVLVDASHEKIKGMIPKHPRATKVLYTTSTLLLKLGPIRRRLLRTLGFEKLPPVEQAFVEELPWLVEGRTSRAEYGGIGPSLTELARSAPDLPPVPTRVLLARGRSGVMTKLSSKQTAAVRKAWEEATEGRTEITLQTVADSGHYISLDQPQAVITAIRDVVDKVSLRRVG